MPVTLDWKEVAWRLAMTVLAGLVIGFNRGEHGRPAGMRTTLLVCLAASLSMIQANLLMNSVGKAQNSFVVLDLMRLPLGVLSGMGFIGAGTILRKGNLVLGVTTAATLWFVTMMGLCFGGGQTGLGLAALGLGCAILWGLKVVEKKMPQSLRGNLSLTIARGGITDEALRNEITRQGCSVVSWGVSGEITSGRRKINCEIQWQPVPGNPMPPAVIATIQSEEGVESFCWQPQGVPSGSDSQQTDPKGTPTSMS